MKFSLTAAILLVLASSGNADERPLACLKDEACGGAKECKVVTVVPNCKKPAKTKPQQSTLTASDCRIGRTSTIPAAAISACEAFLKNRLAPDRIKAEGYFKLGLAYFKHVKGVEYVPWTFYEKREVRYRLLSEAWDKSLKLEPDNVQRLIASANFTAYFMGDYNLAIAGFDRAITIDPENWRAYAARAQTHARGHAMLQAIADGEHAVALAPQQSEARSSLAFIYMEAKRLDEAELEYNRATILYAGPDHSSPPLTGSDPWLGLAEVLVRKGEPAKAASMLSLRLDNIPQDQWPPIYLHLRARYSELARRFGDAADDLSIAQAETADRLVAEVPFKRVVMLIKANRGEEARIAAREELGRLTLQELLSLQIRLNTAGFKSVLPTGEADAPTQEAFIKCFDDENCIGALGRAT